MIDKINRFSISRVMWVAQWTSYYVIETCYYEHFLIADFIADLILLGLTRQRFQSNSQLALLSENYEEQHRYLLN